MVTKESTAHLLPEHWTEEAERIALQIIHTAQSPGQKTHGEATTEATRSICELLDRCVKEAVLLNTAELTKNDYWGDLPPVPPV